MKRITTLIIALTMLLSALFAFTSCQAKEPEPKTPEEVHEILYNWLLDNGELKNGTDVLYCLDDFSIKTSSSQEIEIFYANVNTGNYIATFSLPLLSNEENVTFEITLKKSQDTYVFGCIHSPETFRKNVPLSYEEISRPKEKYIYTSDYGSYKVEGIIRKFVPYPHKADEFYKLKSYNENIDSNTKKAETFAKECSHAALAEILNWLENNICQSTGLTLSDLGYKVYKPFSTN